MKQNLTLTVFSILLATACIVVPSIVQAVTADKASSNASLNRGLVGYWTFDGKDMANGVALDKSGNGHTGLIYNIATSTFYGEGKIGQGLKFDGVNDFIEIGQTSLTNNMTAISASFWLNTSSFASCGSGNGAIIEKQYFTHGWLLGCSNTGYLGMTIYTTGGNGGMTVVTSVPITTNKWKHVVFSWDGNLNGTGAKFYIDGVDSTNLTQAGTGSRINDSSVPLHIARDVYDGQFYGGLMDDVRLYNRALTAAEAKQLYALGSSKQSVSSKVTNTSCTSGLSCGLKAYWTFDGKDIANGVLLDKSGTANPGNFANIATSTFYTEGKIGQGVKLDGSDDYVNVSAVANDVGLGSITMSGWFKPTRTITSSLSSPYYFFTLADGASTNDVRICIARAAAGTNCSSTVSGVSGGKLCILVYNGSGDNAACTSQSTWNADTWYHFVALMDTSGGGEKIYINGVLAGSNAATARGTTQAATACISAEVSTTVCLPSSRVFLGSIDDFRIYNRALSASEIKQLYALGASKQAVSSKVTNTSCSSGLSCGLVGYWTFDGKDMANGVALDKSGNGNNGNLISIATSTFYSEGKIGQAGKFDGVDDYIVVSNPTALNLTNNMSISLWVKHTSSTYLWNIAHRGAGGDQFQFYNIAGTNRLAMWNGATTVSTSGGVSANVWHHLTVTRTGTSIQFYVDGSAFESAQTLAAPSSSTAPLYFLNDTASHFGNAIIDDVRIYNRALSATEVQQLYNAGR